MQPLSGNQRPDRLTAPMKMSLVLRLPRKNASLQILFKCPKVVRTWCALYILTSKCDAPQRHAVYRHRNF